MIFQLGIIHDILIYLRYNRIEEFSNQCKYIENVLVVIEINTDLMNELPTIFWQIRVF